MMDRGSGSRQPPENVVSVRNSAGLWSCWPAARMAPPRSCLRTATGFSRRMVAGLVLAGLATVRRRVIMASDTPVEVGKVMITGAGRDALAAED